MATTEHLLAHLRYALNHLYDPHAQRTSPLIAMLDLSGRADGGYALQQALIRAIESLKPRADVPLHSPQRRSYEILLFRYVQQWSQQEVADQLGISLRHLRREQQTALEVLAERLQEQYHFQAQPEPQPAAESIPPDDEPNPVDDELAWLQGSHTARSIRLNEALPGVLELAQAMAGTHGVSLQVAPIPPDCILAVHPVGFRQVLLSLIGIGIRQMHSGVITITTQPVGPEVRIGLHAPHAPSAFSAEDMASLEIVKRLLDACGGHLELAAGTAAFSATVAFPAGEQFPVLVIDDNMDTLRLLQRYLSGTRYRFLGATTPEQAMATVREKVPQIIVLDVMMPELDGWELLGRLRQHPLTRGIPIIVCTILAEEELASSLGASGFVHKPVSRESFLNALDRQLSPRTSGSH